MSNVKLDTIELAAIVAAGTAVVLAPIDSKPLQSLVADLDVPEPTPAPEPAPVFDETLVTRVRTALGLRRWKPRAELGETETRIVMWSQLELNDLFERVGGTVTSWQVKHDTWTEEEITVTFRLPGVGHVEAVTTWCEDFTKLAARDELPLMRALDAPAPKVLQTVPVRRDGLGGYDLLVVAPGALLPGGRTAVTVEDPLGSSWRVTDDKGTVHYLHKYGELRRYITGVVAFIEPDWAGWACD